MPGMNSGLNVDNPTVVAAAGHVREELSTDPGPGTAATKSSFAALLADAARHALSSP